MPTTVGWPHPPFIYPSVHLLARRSFEQRRRRSTDEEEMENEFWQFSDKLRLETTSSFANLTIGDSIWADSFLTKSRAEERRNLDASRRAAHAPGSIMGAGPLGGKQQQELKDPVFDLNFNDNVLKEQQRAPAFNFNHNGGGWREEPKGPLHDLNADGGGWKQQQQNRPVFDLNLNGGGWKAAMGGSKSAFANGGGSLFNEFGSSPGSLINKDMNKAVNGFGHHQNRRNTDNDVGKGKGATGVRKGGKNNSSNDKNGNDRAAADKRFKTLPASEALPRSEAIGGYIFVCNNDTMQENLRRQLFGLPPRYRDSVRTITPGLPLFLYNYSTHQLHGIFEAASFGGTNIDPTAWEDKKCQGESRFPAQVRVMTRKICEPLEEDSFRPVLHHYDGPKFRLELSVPEALALLDIFAENDA